MDIMNYIDPALGIVLIILWALGIFLKSLKWIKDEYIPFILIAISICLVCLFLGQINGNSIIQGILCAVAAIGGHQVLKQPVKLIQKDVNETIK